MRHVERELWLGQIGRSAYVTTCSPGADVAGPGADVPRGMRATASFSRVINGGWQLSAGHTPLRGAAHEDGLAIMAAAVGAGITSFDCGDIYTGACVPKCACARTQGALGATVLAIHGTHWYSRVLTGAHGYSRGTRCQASRRRSARTSGAPRSHWPIRRCAQPTRAAHRPAERAEHACRGALCVRASVHPVWSLLSAETLREPASGRSLWFACGRSAGRGCVGVAGQVEVHTKFVPDLVALPVVDLACAHTHA